MDLEGFCIAIHALGLSQTRQALAVLWFCDRAEPGKKVLPGTLTRILHDNGLSNPHSTRLGESMLASGHVLRFGPHFAIKPTSRAIIEEWVSQVLKKNPPEIDNDRGYLPRAIWHPTRNYIERIATQINGCYQFAFYDGASVLIRRLTETLLIECYEKLGIESQIKTQDGNYPMLSVILVGAVDRGHLPLGREAKKVLSEVKTAGDRSAHNRRYIAAQHDLEKIQSGVRLVVEELLHLAGLK